MLLENSCPRPPPMDVCYLLAGWGHSCVCVLWQHSPCESAALLPERGGADQPPSSRASKITSLEKQLLIYSASVRRLFLFVNKCGKIKMEMCEPNSTTTKHESFTDTRLVSVPISVCFCRGADPSPQPIYTESTLNVKPQTSAKHMAHTPHLLEAFWRPDLVS